MRYKVGRDPADYRAEMLEAREKPPALPVYAVQTVDGLGRIARPLGGAAPCGSCAAKSGLRGLGATNGGISAGRLMAYGALGLGAVFLGMIVFQKK